MLAVLFYVMITPVWRSCSVAAEGFATPPQRASYWTEKSQSEDLRRYFRQY